MVSHLLDTTTEEKDKRDGRTKFVQELEKRIRKLIRQPGRISRDNIVNR